MRTRPWIMVTWQKQTPPGWSVVRVASVSLYLIPQLLSDFSRRTEAGISAEVVYELASKDMEHFRSSGEMGF